MERLHTIKPTNTKKLGYRPRGFSGYKITQDPADRGPQVIQSPTHPVTNGQCVSAFFLGPVSRVDTAISVCVELDGVSCYSIDPLCLKKKKKNMQARRASKTAGGNGGLMGARLTSGHSRSLEAKDTRDPVD
jgi:hypothetical protein